MSSRHPILELLCLLVLSSLQPNSLLQAIPLYDPDDINQLLPKNAHENSLTIPFGDISTKNKELRQDNLLSSCLQMLDEDTAKLLGWTNQRLSKDQDLNMRSSFNSDSSQDANAHDSNYSWPVFKSVPMTRLPASLSSPIEHPDLGLVFEKCLNLFTSKVAYPLASLSLTNQASGRNKVLNPSLQKDVVSAVLSELKPLSDTQINSKQFDSSSKNSDSIKVLGKRSTNEDYLSSLDQRSEFNDDHLSSQSPLMESKRASNFVGWIRGIEKRRINLSINNALRTLTDMVIQEQVERAMRNRANIRRHMLLQG